MMMRACLPAVLLITVGLTGCNSVYHAARDRVPPGSVATLALRVEEARAAEAESCRVAMLVQDAEKQDRRAVQVRLNQLEVAARDFDRAVLSVNDVASLSGSEVPAEVARLDSRRRRLLDSLASARNGEWSMAGKELGPWIEDSTSVAGGP